MADEVVDIQSIYVLNHLKSNLKLLLCLIESKELNNTKIDDCFLMLYETNYEFHINL